MTDTADTAPAGTAPADVLAEVARWRKAGKDAAVATVIQTWGSAPRQAGSMLGISSEGELAGSVSGGCVEGAVLEEALEIMKTGAPKLLTFGVSDDEAWTVGLACGGTIRVFVEKVG